MRDGDLLWRKQTLRMEISGAANDPFETLIRKPPQLRWLLLW
jgi:hypothetical protein